MSQPARQLLVRAAPPGDLWALLDRARQLTDQTVGALWDRHGQGPLPDLRRHKGLVGQLIEAALGASGGSDAQPDLPHLFAPDGSPGVELKTVPLQPSGRPAESTWVSRLPMRGALVPFAESSVARKLACVLWIPLDAGPDVAQRRLHEPRLWQPDWTTWQHLQADYDAALELLAAGRTDELNGRLGELLQVRPKAANARSRVEGSDAEGRPTDVLQRGFYLRPGFVEQVLRAAQPVSAVRRWG